MADLDAFALLTGGLHFDKKRFAKEVKIWTGGGAGLTNGQRALAPQVNARGSSMAGSEQEMGGDAFTVLVHSLNLHSLGEAHAKQEGNGNAEEEDSEEEDEDDGSEDAAALRRERVASGSAAGSSQTGRSLGHWVC